MQAAALDDQDSDDDYDDSGLIEYDETFRDAELAEDAVELPEGI